MNAIGSWGTSSILLVASVALIYRTINNITAALRDARQNAHALERMNRAYRVLSESNQTLVRATEQGEFLSKICNILVKYGSYQLAWVDLRNDTGDSAVVAHAGGSLDDVVAASSKMRTRAPSEFDTQLYRPAETNL